MLNVNSNAKIKTVNVSAKIFGGQEDLNHRRIYFRAPIDSITNVYTMGVLLFGLIGGESDRSFDTVKEGNDAIRRKVVGL